MSNKKRVVFQAPIYTQSGYGHRARDLAKCLLSYEDFVVYFIPTDWGGTPWTGVDNESEFGREVKKRIVLNLDFKPDIYIQHTIPNEFQSIGNYNIGITAGIETDMCAPSWVEGINRMDVVIGSTNHSLMALKNSSFNAVDKRTGQIVNQLRAKDTLGFRVLLEAVDTTPYNKVKTPVASVAEFLDEIPQDFAFLFVGQWMHGDAFQDRKDVAGLIKTFVTTFAKQPRSKQPALILKTSTGSISAIDEENVLYRIKSIVGDLDKAPPIYLMYGDLDEKEMVSLYKHPKVKAMISMTKGEGFGRPLAEFAILGKPVIVPNWSGQVDFILPQYHTLLPGTMTPVHESVLNDWFYQGSKWFTVDYGAASQALKQMQKNYDSYLKRAQEGKSHIRKILSFEKMKKDLKIILEESVKEDKPLFKLELPKI